jgi:DNA-binding SARP family transcriptional activator
MEFRVLGPLEVRDGERSFVLAGPKQRAVLALLLLDGNTVVSSERLVDQLWGEEPPESARTMLQGYISHLRKELGVATIQTRATGYVIEIASDQLDLHRFERLVGEAREAAAKGDHETAAAQLREALELWRGPALVDFAYEPFAQAPIARLEELRLTALGDRIEADLALGRHGQLVGELEALVVEHPLRERLRGQLMLALYRSGRQAEALDVYRETRHVLIDTLGIEPGQPLQELERAILRRDPVLAPPAPAGREPAAAPVAVNPPMRAILAVAEDEQAIDALLALAAPLAQDPPRELILALLVSTDSDLAAATAGLGERRAELGLRRVAARVAAFTSRERGSDTTRLASDQHVDLLLLAVPGEVAGGDALLPDLVEVLRSAPCDVGALIVAGGVTPAPSVSASVCVPFGGAEHEWAAAEVGAWIARSVGAPLRLLGTAGDPGRGRRDASRLLATASLAIQQVSGVLAEPVVAGSGPEAVLAAADGAGLIVIGLSDRWQSEGLGPGRLTIVQRARSPVLVVRGGLRPGGLAPSESLTRYTWSVGTET